MKDLLHKQFPGGLPRTHAGNRQKSLGSIKNFFKQLPQTAQNALVDDEFISLLEYMLQMSPSKRPTAAMVLLHPFFSSDNMPDTKDVQHSLQELLKTELRDTKSQSVRGSF